MKVFSIIGDKKMREDVEPKILKALEEDGFSVGFIKRTDNISSNSQTKRAIIWGEHQSLFYHENKSSLFDLLKLFDEDYVIVDNDEKSDVPKLLMYEEVDLDNTADVNELGNMHNLKRREDVFFVADDKTEFADIVSAIKEKVSDILPDQTDSEGEEVELLLGDTALQMPEFAKAILKNSVEAVARELEGYKEGTELKVVVRK